MTSPKVEWRGRSDFAEIAETLGITTDAVLAARLNGKRIFVFYTPDMDEELMWSVFLKRGMDGILVQDGAPVKHPGLWDTIKQQIAEGGFNGR